MKRQTIIFFSLLALFVSSCDKPQTEYPWLRLSDEWRFAPGDDMAWAETAYDDSQWAVITTQSCWEHQGFSDLDGYAWYRQSVVIPESWREAAEREGGLYLTYASADDADEAFFNGVSLGRNGDFPPNYNATPGQPRKFLIAPELIRYDQPNVIALRVYDGVGFGGVTSDSIILAVANPVADIQVRLSSPEDHWVFAKGEYAAIDVEALLDAPKDVRFQLACLIENDFHQPVDSMSLSANLSAGKPLKKHLRLPITKPGFYRVTVYARQGGLKSTPAIFTVGREPEAIVSPTDAQPDFDAFWDETLAELAQTPMNARVSQDARLSNEKKTVYRVTLNSFGGKQIEATYAVPNGEGPFPVLLTNLGYAQGEDNGTVNPDNMPGYCELVLSVRGQGLQINDKTYGEWITYGVKSKEDYYYRGAYMDLVRAVDFLASRPEVDSRYIFAGGVSQGGAFTLAVAALDHRICAAAPCVPFLSDFPDYFRLVDWPRDRFELAMEADSTLMWPDIYKVLSYFDIKNFASRIQCPVMMAAGLQDDICPPHTNFSGYNLIQSEKRYIIYPYQGHGVEDSWYDDRRAFFDGMIEN